MTARAQRGGSRDVRAARRFELALVIVGLAGIAACDAPAPAGPWLVDGPRLLAVRGVPAEAAPGTSIRLEALFVDVDGLGEEALVRFAWCRRPREVDERGPIDPGCLDPEHTTEAPDPADAKLPPDGCEAFGPLAPPAEGGEPPRRPADPDATGGFYQPVIVRAPDADDGAGQMRISCGLTAAPAAEVRRFQEQYVANEHPEVLALEIAGASGSVVAPGADVELRAAWALSDEEPYVVYDPVAREVVDALETTTLSWYATGGRLLSERSLDEPAVEKDQRVATNRLTAPSAPGALHIIVVLRDSRGGVAWAVHRIDVEGEGSP